MQESKAGFRVASDRNGEVLFRGEGMEGLGAPLPGKGAERHCASALEEGAVTVRRRLHRASPAVSFVGRHNSGKTTLLEKVIAELVARGLYIGTVKHHGHPGFDIDYPGKDSYRHREAGSRDVVIASGTRVARVTEFDHEPECSEIVGFMNNHDLVIVEGYRESGLPVIEVMRAANERDVVAAEEFCATGLDRGVAPVAVVTDMPHAAQAAERFGMRAFGLEDVREICDYLCERYVRPKLSVAIQAGGESRRMGRSKATVPFLGRPLLARIVERMAPVADEIVITTNEPENLGFLSDVHTECDIRLVRDVYEDRGALRGLRTAFGAVRYPLVAVVACDMVFASAALAAAEADVLHAEGADAVVPQNKNGFEPFHAVYRTQTCLAAIEAALAQGNARAKDFFNAVNLRPFTVEDVARAVPERGCFVNANTPEELAHLQESIIEEGDR